MTNEQEIQRLERRIDDVESDLNDGAKYIGQQIGYAHLISSRKVGYSVALFYLPGVTLSMILSWSVNVSIFWTIIHGYLSWIYVTYFIVFVQ